jgi:hypothetical protein
LKRMVASVGTHAADFSKARERICMARTLVDFVQDAHHWQAILAQVVEIDRLLETSRPMDLPTAVRPAVKKLFIVR